MVGRPSQKIDALHRAQVINAILDIFSGAEHKIDVCGNSRFPFRIFSFDSVKKSTHVAKNRGIQQRYIFEITKENINSGKDTMKFGSLHHMDQTEASFALNENEFLGSIILCEPEQAIYSNLREILEQQHSIFETLWNKSIPAENIIGEIEAGVEPEFLELISDRRKATEIYIDLAKSVEKKLYSSLLIAKHRLEQID